MFFESIAIGLGLLGIAIGLLAWRRLRARQFVTGCAQGGASGLALLASVLLVAGAAHLHTYRRLTHEHEVATLEFTQVGPAAYSVTVVGAHAELESRRYLLRGQEWQLDARVLKWQPWANLLGLDAHYRIERLSGRYQDVAEETTAPRTIYRLGTTVGIDIWRVARAYPQWFPGLDAVYGTSVYLPMGEGAEYRVSMTQSGLLARPENTVAAQLIQGWQ